MLRPYIISCLVALCALALAPVASARADAESRVELVVGLERPAAALDVAGVRVVERLPAVDAVVVSVAAGRADAALAALRADGAVEYAARESTRTPALAPNDPGYLRQAWPFLRAAVPAAWDVTTGDGGAVIAVLDSGIDPSHPDLPPLAAGYDFVNDDADPADDHGHGTTVAGAIAARLGNGLGSAGVCPRCTLMPIKVLDGVSGEASDADIVAGIVWATDHGADVINISLSGPDYGQALADAVAYATSRGVVVVAAGGNDGTSALQYPAALDGVVGVAASDDRNALYDFSNHGSHLDLAAPGCLQTTLNGGRYGQACGTSLAAPFVAGVAGLVRSRRPALSGAQVVDVLAAGAVRGLGLDVEDGLVDAAKALRLADQLAPAAPETLVAQAAAGNAAVAIGGTARVGRTLVARWSGGANGLRFQWQACRAVHGVQRCTNLAGATSAALRIGRGQVGLRLRVRATVTAADGTRSVLSSRVSAVVRT